MLVGVMSFLNNEELLEFLLVVYVYWVFGFGGLKVCVICGSKDYFWCNDCRKMFMD